MPSKALEDPRTLRIFAADDEVVDAADREAVEEVALDLWRSEHVFDVDALTEVAAAAAATTAAKQRLDAAVALARHSGATWASIGRSAGVARQSAQERWRHVDGFECCAGRGSPRKRRELVGVRGDVVAISLLRDAASATATSTPRELGSMAYDAVPCVPAGP